MSVENQQNGPVSTLAEGAPRTKVSLTPLFTTWVYVCPDGPKHLNPRLEELAHRLMQEDSNAITRTNRGGWHYAFDIFNLGSRWLQSSAIKWSNTFKLFSITSGPRVTRRKIPSASRGGSM